MPEEIAILTGSSNRFRTLTSVESAKAEFRPVAAMCDIPSRHGWTESLSRRGLRQDSNLVEWCRWMDVSNAA
jgi:hypothetical protein